MSQVYKEHSMETKEDLDVCINGAEYNNRLYLSVFGDDELWISMSVPNARANMTIKKEQAKDMIAALIRLVDHLEE